MKKLYFLLFLLGAVVLSQGQVVNNNDYKLKGDGQAFFTEDFDWENPDDIKGWSLPEGWELLDFTDDGEGGTYGLNFLWMAADSLVSNWVAEPSFRSTTADNGYLCLPLDGYNTDMGLRMPAERLDLNNSIQLAPIDCSSHNSVVIKFVQNFMRYGSGNTMQVEVSNDEGVHWAFYDCSENTIHKQRPKDVPPGTPALFEANISDVAAGMDNVIIRLHWENTDCYYWVIDDLSLSEAYDNDMQIMHTTMEFDRGVEEDDESVYYMIPKTQIGGGGFTNFEAGYRNFGELDQTDVKLDVEVIKNNQQVFHAQSEPVTSPSLGDPDTLFVNDIYYPTEFGHYRINMKYVASAEDNNPADNSKHWDFHVNDSVYSRSGDVSDYPFSTGYDSYPDLTEGWVDYAIFPIQADCEANSISVFIQGGDNEIDFNFVIIDPNVEEGEEIFQRVTTDFLDLDSSMYNTWVTLPLEKDGEGEFLTAGNTYYVGIQYWLDAADDDEGDLIRRNRNLYLGSSRVMKLKNSVSGRFTNGTDYSRYYTINFMIRLNIDNHENIVDGIYSENAFNTLDQNYPNPFTTLTEVNYELASGSQVILEVCDITGRKVLEINEGYRPAGKHKIKVNANNLESGIYNYTLVSDNFRETKRMVISR
ncbi:T9SS type A sorting domain-containing protein [Bacteroidota bacterium]